jgi:hypothetical protein
VDIAAHDNNCFLRSLLANGKSRFFSKSLRDMSATKAPSSETMGSLAFLDPIKI